MRFRRTTILALVVAMLAVPTTALADDVPDTERTNVTDTQRDTTTDRRAFDRAKERALHEIDIRLRALDGLSEKISTNRFITEGHAGQLRGDITPAAAHLEALRRQVEDAETWAELLPLIEKIDDDKVFAVIAPKTAQVIASDALVAFAAKATSFSSTLETVIARFDEAGFDVDEAWRMLDEMNDLITEGEQLADPVAESVIGLDASDWPEPAKSVLASGREDLHAAGSALRDARATGVDIVQFLRNLFDGRTDATAETDANEA